MKIKSSLLAACAVFSLGALPAGAALIAAFDFQTTTTGGTAAVASAVGTPSPLVYSANIGTATLYLNGTNGASTFTTGVTNPQVTSFGGSAINTSGGLSTTTSGAASLTIANSSSNSSRLVFVFSMTDLENLSISYSTQSTATGFNLQTWSYSTDGVTFTTFDSFVPGGTGSGPLGANLATTFGPTGTTPIGVVTLDTLTALDGLDTVYIGLTLTGASSATANNRLDNIQFNTIPEPDTAALVGMIGLLGLLRRRR